MSQNTCISCSHQRAPPARSTSCCEHLGAAHCERDEGSSCCGHLLIFYPPLTQHLLLLLHSHFFSPAFLISRLYTLWVFSLSLLGCFPSFYLMSYGYTLVCLPACLSAYLPVSLPACLPGLVARWLAACIPSFLPSFLPSFHPSIHPSIHPACLSACLPSLLSPLAPSLRKPSEKKHNIKRLYLMYSSSQLLVILYFDRNDASL